MSPMDPIPPSLHERLAKARAGYASLTRIRWPTPEAAVTARRLIREAKAAEALALKAFRAPGAKAVAPWGSAYWQGPATHTRAREVVGAAESAE
jgi:hypothetical protein